MTESQPKVKLIRFSCTKRKKIEKSKHKKRLVYPKNYAPRAMRKMIRIYSEIFDAKVPDINFQDVLDVGKPIYVNDYGKEAIVCKKNQQN